MVLLLYIFPFAYMYSMPWLSLPAGVHMAFTYGASEEALTAIAARSPIVFSSSFVSTDCTVSV